MKSLPPNSSPKTTRSWRWRKRCVETCEILLKLGKFGEKIAKAIHKFFHKLLFINSIKTFCRFLTVFFFKERKFQLTGFFGCWGGGMFDHIVENLIIVFLMTDHTRHFGVQNMVLNLFVEHFGSFSVLKLNSSKIFIFSYFSSVRVARNNLISASTRLTLKRSSICWKRRNRSSTLKEEKSEGTLHSIFYRSFEAAWVFSVSVLLILFDFLRLILVTREVFWILKIWVKIIFSKDNFGVFLKHTLIFEINEKI